MSARPSSLVLVGLACAVGACLGGRTSPLGAHREWQLANGPFTGHEGTLCAPGASDAADEDHDGLSDVCEETLAQRFAPIVIHSTDESNFPTNVDTFLSETSLIFRDDSCDAAREILVARSPTESDLVGESMASPCDGAKVASAGSRSVGKHKTFFLRDVPDADRRGSEDSRQWTTYVHAYPNVKHGITVQYWRFYAYNDAFNDHGGDWEGLHVALDERGAVSAVRLLQHSAMMELAPDELQWEGDHPLVYSEGGGHASRARGDGIVARGCAHDDCFVNLAEPKTYIWQETWRGGRVGWPDGRVTVSGGLLDMGEKSSPSHGQLFLRYSGLWGSPGVFYSTSGYWGPAYNETSMSSDGFTASWCAGMAGVLDRHRECWASDREP